MKTFKDLYMWLTIYESLEAANEARDRWELEEAASADRLSTLLSKGFVWFSDTSKYSLAYWQDVHNRLKAEEAQNEKTDE